MARKFQNPKGTRDFYPLDMLRRRYVTEAWRAVSLRHAFEEIDGPTFEHLDLYTVKSGDEIVSQLFSFTRAGGKDTYALRPEFTPTLARMYAAQAATLPRPVRWFSILPYFRAERPQRGRLREFLQWNCDVIGDDSARADTEIAAITASSLDLLGLRPEDTRIKLNDRHLVQEIAEAAGLPSDRIDAWFAFLDGMNKRSAEANEAFLRENDIPSDLPDRVAAMFDQVRPADSGTSQPHDSIAGMKAESLVHHSTLANAVRGTGIGQWCDFLDMSIVRGLAYYTGTVFEVIAEGERAVAGGGRYDNLIKLLGGPDTPAVGFAMGDVVLANLLEDKGLMPTDDELPAAVEAMTRSQSVRPEVFVVAGAEEDDQRVTPLVANLRRGIERDNTDARPWQTAERYDVPPLHARTTDKTTHNLKKLLADAERQRARLAAVIHADDKVQLKDLDAREDLGDFSIDPDSPQYLGRAVADRLGRAPAQR